MSILTEVNKTAMKTITPNRTPPRSRANSIGESQEDPYAPPTEERIEQVRIQLIDNLIESGFITVKKPKITSIIPT